MELGGSLPCLQDSPPLAHILSQINPVCALQSCFFMIHVCVILQPMPEFSMWSFSSIFFHQNLVCISFLFPHKLHVPPISFSSIWSPEQYVMSSTHYEASHYAVFSSLLSFPPVRSTNLLSTLFSNTLSICSSLIVIDQVSHTYTTTVRIIVLRILTL